MVKCTKKQIRQLKTQRRWKIPAAQRERIQMVLLRESGMTQPAIAEAMGVSLSTVNRAHMAYDGGGINALTLGGEKALLGHFAAPKLLPRPFPPKRDVAAQQAFKKTAFQLL